MRAYSLMRHAADLNTVWLSSPRWTRFREPLEQIRHGVGVNDVARYRGIGRFPLTEWQELGPGWEAERRDEAADPEPDARALLLAALGSDDHHTPSPRAFIPSLRDARSVMRALRSPARYELVELTLMPDVPDALLGFDVGYWGGGNYSVLCDAAIWPTWHPPEPTALRYIARFMSGLNGSLLFPTADAAGAYLDWYAEESWGEKPAEDFRVIGVGEVSHADG